jgi:hypothetical protein
MFLGLSVIFIRIVSSIWCNLLEKRVDWGNLSFHCASILFDHWKIQYWLQKDSTITWASTIWPYNHWKIQEYWWVYYIFPPDLRSYCSCNLVVPATHLMIHDESLDLIVLLITGRFKNDEDLIAAVIPLKPYNHLCY